jgi:hypothetical protein
MICVRYIENPGGPADEPVWLDGETRAVSAAPYVTVVDQGQGGIITSDISNPETIRPIASFAAGDIVYVESSEQGDVLFDDDLAAECSSRIWWKATILPVG